MGTKGKPSQDLTEKGPVSAVETKRELSPEQRRELLRENCKPALRKTGTAMNLWNGRKCKESWKRILKNSGRLVKWNELAVNRTWLVMAKKLANTRFAICSAETPKGRRNVCYDREGQKAREKEGLHPAGNVIDMAGAMGIEPLTEEQYRELQEIGEFDTKTQSWLKNTFRHPETRRRHL
jgi:hypothetical protein